MDAEWPASPWSSSAPESYVLLHFHRKPSAKAALKLAVLELLARRRLRLLELRTRGRWRRRHTVLLPGDGAEGGAPLGAALEPLWEVYRSRRPKTFRGIPLSGEADGDGGSPKVAGAPEQRVVGVEVKDFAQAVVRRFGSVDRYLNECVRPALVARGWVAAEPYRILWIFPATRWVLTLEGTAAQGDLLWRVAYGNRELGRLVDEAPERAIAFAGLAGAAVLLMDDARPHLKRLRERLVEGARPEAQAAAAGTVGVDGTPVAGGAALDAAAVPDGGGLDLSGVDLSGVDLADLGGFDLGALDGLDAAFDAVGAIDAGVDSGAGGGGGGDGGGGSSS